MNMNKVCWSPILFIYFLSPFESFFFFPFYSLDIFIETTEFTDSQSENHFGVSSIFVCRQKKKKLAKLEEKIRSQRSV